MRWCAFLLPLIGFFCTVRADEPAARFRSLFEVQRDLLGGGSSLTRGQFPEGDVQLRNSPDKKSVGLAAIYSLLVPGMGELYTGAFSSGKYFLTAEGVLWLTFTGFQLFGDALKNDARAFAAARAGVNLAGKDDQYFIDIGNFLNINDYNQKKLRDRDPSKLYDPAAGYAWQWDSDASRAMYRDQRVASDNMYNDRLFVVGAVLVNHVASAINAARSAISHNKELENSLGDLHFKADVMGGIAHPHGILLTVIKEF